jgi:nucleotide-binding universal stress UspA family protein
MAMSVQTTVIVIAVWLLAGVVPALLMMRRGHGSWYWVLIGIGLGPFAAPVLWERMEGDESGISGIVEAPGRRSPGASVLVALDGSASGSQAIGFVDRILDPAATSVTLVTVLDFDADTTARDAAAGLLEEASKALARFSPRALLVTGPALEQLLELIERENPGLVVVGARGSGLTKAVLGSVSQGLLRRSGAPVVVLPAA